MRTKKESLFLLNITKNRKNEILKWTEIKFYELIKGKGKVFFMPFNGDENYVEMLEIINVSEKSVKADLYNYNSFQNNIYRNRIIFSVVDGEIKAEMVDGVKLDRSELSKAPIPFCNFVSKRLKLGKIESIKRNFFKNCDFMKATTVNQEKNKDIIFIEKIDMSEYKNPKTVMKYKERKKRSKLFSHFFHNSTFKEVIKNKKAGKYI